MRSKWSYLSYVFWLFVALYVVYAFFYLTNDQMESKRNVEERTLCLSDLCIEKVGYTECVPFNRAVYMTISKNNNRTFNIALKSTTSSCVSE